MRKYSDLNSGVLGAGLLDRQLGLGAQARGRTSLELSEGWVIALAAEVSQRMR